MQIDHGPIVIVVRRTDINLTSVFIWGIVGRLAEKYLEIAPKDFASKASAISLNSIFRTFLILLKSAAKALVKIEKQCAAQQR